LFLKEGDEPRHIFIFAERNAFKQLLHLPLMLVVVIQQILLLHQSEPVFFLERLYVLLGDGFVHLPIVVVGVLEGAFVELLPHAS
jgi:hypothetical protein